MKPIDFFSRVLRDGNKISLPEPSLNSHNAEKTLWDFMKLKTNDTFVFTLEYISSNEKFKRFKNKERIREARTYLMSQGYIICFHANDLNVSPFGDLIYSQCVYQNKKIFKDVIEQNEKEDLILSDFVLTKINFEKFGNKILNVSIFEHEILFNRIWKNNNYVDSFGRTWLYHWEQTFNFWLENYYPLIKNNL